MKFKYTTIIVENIKKSTEFYEEVLDLQKIEEYEIPDEFYMVMLTDGENIIELVQNGEYAHIQNIGLEVNDMSSTIYELEDRGIALDINEEHKLVTLKDPNDIEIILSEKRIKD